MSQNTGRACSKSEELTSVVLHNYVEELHVSSTCRAAASRAVSAASRARAWLLASASSAAAAAASCAFSSASCALSSARRAPSSAFQASPAIASACCASIQASAAAASSSSSSSSSGVFSAPVLVELFSETVVRLMLGARNRDRAHRRLLRPRGATAAAAAVVNNNQSGIGEPIPNGTPAAASDAKVGVSHTT